MTLRYQSEFSVLYDPPRPNKFSKTEISIFTVYYLHLQYRGKQCILRIVRTVFAAYVSEGNLGSFQSPLIE